MLLGSRSRSAGRENITPAKTAAGARSRKCLDLSLKKGPPRGLPLGQTHNLPRSPHATPGKDVGESLGSPELFLSSSPAAPPSPSLSVSSLIPIPSTLLPSVPPPKTPRSVLADPIRRRNLTYQNLMSPASIKSPMRRSPRKKVKKSAAPRPKVLIKEIPKPPPPPAIKTASFYSRSLVTTPPQEAAAVVTPAGPTETKARPKETRSLPTMHRAAARGSLRRRSGGGAKRKGSGGLRGVGHGIKKPKYKPQHPVLKISELPVMSIEIPRKEASTKSSSSTVSAPSTPSTTSTRKTPSSTSGQISLTHDTKVQFEVRAGQFVYRAKPKAGITPRRSPRKLMSPLKADYFRGRDTTPSRDTKRLFSPVANFLSPSSQEEEGEGPGVPSPVKFHDSSQDTGDDSAPDLSAILASLNNTGDVVEMEEDDEEQEMEEDDEEQEMEEEDEEQEGAVASHSSLAGELTLSVSLPVVSLSQQQEEDSSLALALEAVSQLASLAPASAAVTDILAELSSGESTDTSSQGGDELSREEAEDSPEVAQNFPIFYRETARTGEGAASTSSLQPGKRFLCKTLGPDQAFIDAGQKEVGATVCSTCGTVYTIGDPGDEAAHAAQHSGLLERLRLVGWARERLVGQFPGGRVLQVRPGDDQRWWKKVEDALGVVDRDLGFSEVGIRSPDSTKVFLYVADKKIVGLLLAERVAQGYRILPPTEESSGRVYCCSESPSPVLCGISRIWVLADYRRKRVASSLVDCMRSTFFADRYLAETDFAFSDPTLHGIEFATKYVGHTNFLVYRR